MMTPESILTVVWWMRGGLNEWLRRALVLYVGMMRCWSRGQWALSSIQITIQGLHRIRSTAFILIQQIICNMVQLRIRCMDQEMLHLKRWSESRKHQFILCLAIGTKEAKRKAFEFAGQWKRLARHITKMRKEEKKPEPNPSIWHRPAKSISRKKRVKQVYGRLNCRSRWEWIETESKPCWDRKVEGWLTHANPQALVQVPKGRELEWKNERGYQRIGVDLEPMNVDWVIMTL